MTVMKTTGMLPWVKVVAVKEYIKMFRICPAWHCNINLRFHACTDSRTYFTQTSKDDTCQKVGFSIWTGFYALHVHKFIWKKI
jgi:hypothetical protein